MRQNDSICILNKIREKTCGVCTNTHCEYTAQAGIYGAYT